mmetsp:Transcript_50450/g.127144  ORF Transcript_50450/g.127144 Transcript_50450/m.127144 type:complete len:245 (+) Transcript_50450:768-1502(+)
MSSCARGSKRLHSAMRAALRNGVEQLTAKSKGTSCSKPQAREGASKVTFGSWPRKAERRNLKPRPEATRMSVQVRMADFCSLRLSSCPSPPPPPLPPPPLPPPRPECRGTATSSAGLTVMTRSTSGTATLQALPRAISPLAKAATSAPGKVLRSVCCTTCARRPMARSPSGVGQRRARSSWTSPSQPCAAKLGGSTGWQLFFRRSLPGAAAAAEVRRGFGCKLGFTGAAWQGTLSPNLQPSERG